jgi:hypothetical protein
MGDWKTTVSAVVAAFSGWVVIEPQYFPVLLVSACKYFFPTALVSLGWQARDKK